VNNHRKANGLYPISCHDKPRYLATQHVYDLRKASPSCRGDLHEWKSSDKTGGRPCSRADCRLLKMHLGGTFAAATIGSGGGYGEISAGGGGSSGRSDINVFNGWKNSPGHNQIMLKEDGEYPVFGCFNGAPGEYAHCIFFPLDKKLPGGSFFIRDCA